MKQWVEQFNGRMDAWGRKLQGKEIRIPIDLVTGIVFALERKHRGSQGRRGRPRICRGGDPDFQAF